MNDIALGTYLTDHLTGATGALWVVGSLDSAKETASEVKQDVAPSG